MLNDFQIVKVECGSAHTIALSLTGEVYSWGFGDSGCLGLGPDIVISKYPQKIEFKAYENDEGMLLSGNQLKSAKITQISSGSSHCLALSETKKVYSWGNG